MRDASPHRTKASVVLLQQYALTGANHAAQLKQGALCITGMNMEKKNSNAKWTVELVPKALCLLQEHLCMSNTSIYLSLLSFKGNNTTHTYRASDDLIH